MADFTLWRFHQCNENFLHDFWSDKKRVVFWITAFLLIFWTRSGDVFPAPDYPAVLSCAGVYLLLVETAYIANRLFGRDVEFLTGWLLLATPAFHWYAKYGGEQPLTAAIGLLAILFACKVRQLTFLNAVFTGMICAAASLCGNILAGAVFPLLCIWMLHKPDSVSSIKQRCLTTIGILLGLTVLAVPLAAWKPGDTILQMSITEWSGRFILRIFLSGADSQIMVLLSALAPWFWLTIPALGALHKILTADRMNENRLERYVYAVGFAVIAGGILFGFGFLLPFMILLTAYILLNADNMLNGSRRERYLTWSHRTLNLAGTLFLIAMLVLAFAAPFLPGIYYQYHHGQTEITVPQATMCYIRLPLAGLLLLFSAVCAWIRKKRGKAAYFAPGFCFLDTLIPGLCGFILAVMP